MTVLFLMLLLCPSAFAIEDDDELLVPAEFSKLHALIDLNKDGKINVTELVLYHNAQQIHGEMRDIRIDSSEIDTDHDGKVELEEFMEFTRFAERGDHDSEHTKSIFELEKVKFHAADKNGDGFVIGDEMIALMHPQFDPEVAAVVSKATFAQRDKDGNGMLSMTEVFELPEADIDPEHMIPEFKSADQDGDGVMSLAEFTRYDTGLHYYEGLFQKWLDTLDTDGDSQASEAELLAKREVITTGGGAMMDDPAGEEIVQWIFNLNEPVETSVDGRSEDEKAKDRDQQAKDRDQLMENHPHGLRSEL